MPKKNKTEINSCINCQKNKHHNFLCHNENKRLSKKNIGCAVNMDMGGEQIAAKPTYHDCP